MLQLDFRQLLWLTLDMKKGSKPWEERTSLSPRGKNKADFYNLGKKNTAKKMS